jgi:hypothetical protein
MSKIKIQELNSHKSTMVTLKPREANSVCGGLLSDSNPITGGVDLPGGGISYPNPITGSYDI